MAQQDPQTDGQVNRAIGGTVSATTGGMGVAGGAGCIISGIALTSTGVLAPVGIALIIGGTVGTILGAGALAGAVTSLRSRNRRNGGGN